MSQEANLDAYLKRINYAGSIAPTLETLSLLHQLHPAAIPFENLDPMMEVPVRLQLSDLEQKLIVEKRGGYCFEQNLLFKAVLEAMDYSVTPLAAGVLWGRAPDAYPPPLNHMILAVDIAGSNYLCDVGFGGQVLTAPLRFKAELEQETPHERFRLVGDDSLWRLETEIGGEWRPLYQFDMTARTLDDYIALNDAVAPVFRDELRAARTESGRRFALRGNRLNIHVTGGETETKMLSSVVDIRDALTGTFGIQLPQNERLDPALARALPQAAD
ncbi:MAG TPA: arylamine N-acetyltransferase [Devosia sp.]|nr:arylamine N-acetyltransferase [Devosia sp.]